MLDLSLIRPNLYIGSAPWSREAVSALTGHHITAVLSLQTDSDLAENGLLWERIERWYSSVGMHTRRLPIRDYSPEALVEKVGEAVGVLQVLLAEGHTVYMHCSAGVNRSPTIAIAYLVEAEKLSVDEALGLVTAARPRARPYEQALAHLRSRHDL
jgi:protein-tyrosine phosphatase